MYEYDESVLYFGWTLSEACRNNQQKSKQASIGGTVVDDRFSSGKPHHLQIKATAEVKVRIAAVALMSPTDGWTVYINSTL